MTVTDGDQDGDTGTYPLDALVQRVRAELDRRGMEQVNGQVSAYPDGRTLRYYTSLGLLDPPVETRGRRAYYGRRHLLQAVAVKALQAQGLPLQEIQLRLTGQSDEQLVALIGRPTAPRFWTAPPETAAGDAIPEAEAAASGRGSAVAISPIAVRLSDGVVLVVEPAISATTDDIQAIQAAAGPLVHELRRRGLLPDPKEAT